MSKALRLSDSEIKIAVHELLSEYLSHPVAVRMKDFIQHGDVSTYDHALAVAYRCYKMAYGRKNVDIRLLTVCAFLHDLYLYHSCKEVRFDMIPLARHSKRSAALMVWSC